MPQRIILGMGADPVALGLLAAILAEQRSARVTAGQVPLLPWNPPPGGPGIRERFARWKATGAAIVGDVAASYLPHAEEAVAAEPGVRMACLTRPKAEVIASLRGRPEDDGPTPMDHWARQPAPGWTHHPFRTRTYPQYDTRSRDEGIGLYWEEYRARSVALQRRHPGNFRIVEAGALGDPDAVRSLLDFLGVPPEDRVVVTGRLPREEARSEAAGPRWTPLDPRRCVVLVPFGGPIVPDCEAGLRALERLGYPVRRVGGHAAIDQVRNQMATDALADGFDELMWIDSDVVFRPEDVEALRRLGLPMACGIYPKKGSRVLACHVLPGTPRLTFGKAGGPVEILYAGAGFLLARREVYLTIQARLGLPVCNERFGKPMIPFFEPMVRTIEDGHWSLGEDYAFSERARRAGFRVIADTSLRLWHVGAFRFGWEDAGTDRDRFGTFTIEFDRPEP